MRPVRSFAPLLTFPNWNRRLQRIDSEASRFECLWPMWCRHDDEDGRFAELEFTHAMHECNPPQVRPGATHFVRDLETLRDDLFVVCLVCQRRDVRSSFRMIANCSRKHNDCATAREDRPVVEFSNPQLITRQLNQRLSVVEEASAGHTQSVPEYRDDTSPWHLTSLSHVSPDDDELGEHFFNAPLPPYERAWVHPSERAQGAELQDPSWFDRSSGRTLALFSILTGLTTSLVLLVVALPGSGNSPAPDAIPVTSEERQSPVNVDPTTVPIAAALTESGLLISVLNGATVGQTVHVATPEAAEFDAVVIDVEPTLGVSMLKVIDPVYAKSRLAVTPVSDDEIQPGAPVWVATAAFGIELSHISSSTPGTSGTHIPLEPFSSSHHGGTVFTSDGSLIGWCVERDGRHWLLSANVARSAVLRLESDVVQP